MDTKKCLECGKDFSAPGRKCAACIKRAQRNKKAYQAGEIVEGLAGVVMGIEQKFNDPVKQKNYEGFMAQLPAIQWLATGTALDKLTLLPKDKITLIYGKFGVGKSTMAHILAARTSLKTLYIDTEAALTPERLSDLGVDCSKFTVLKENLVEKIYEMLLDEKTLQRYDLIIWDSVANSVCLAEAQAPASDGMSHLIKPKILNRLFRLLPLMLDRHKTTLILINQERVGVGQYVPNSVPGGVVQMHSSSIVMRLTGTYPKITAEIKKSRVGDAGKLEFVLHGTN